MDQCDMGVGCEMRGICYAEAMGSPERCGIPEPQFEEGDWITIEGMDKWQFKAYEYGGAEVVQFVNDVLDGKRQGGTMNEPAHSLREQLLALHPYRQWEAFITSLNKVQPIRGDNKEHVSFLGSIESYRKIFMEANERTRASDSPAG